MTEISSGEPAAPARQLPRGDRGMAATNGGPGEPDELRREIEATRARMSRTLDAIEGRIVRQKEELVARATFRELRQKVASEPWRSMLIAFAAGYIIAAIRD